jgi:pseudouridine-5'-phosphate glycosidase
VVVNAPLRLDHEVDEALTDGRPVVALEATILTQPGSVAERLAAALAVEQAARDAGAVPAMVGVGDGRVLVGMAKAERERFAAAARLPKVANRDLGPALAAGGIGVTTVSATLLLAQAAGIPVLATGGIGGVHRAAQQTFDVSADLVQLSRSRVSVVCAGAKSVLDLALTLEYLETFGVPVLGYRCDDLPAFYCRSSGLPNQRRVDDMAELARAVQAHWAVGNQGGVLVTHPIPEDDALDPVELESLIDAALAAAEREGVRGAAITPYLLRSVDTATGGRSTAANRAVLLTTARAGGQLATALANLAAA